MQISPQKLMKPIFLLLIIFGLSHSDVLDLANFELRPNALGTELQKRTDELGNILEAKASVTMIMNNLNRPTSGGGIAVDGDACNKDAIVGMPAIGRSICFDNADSNTSQWFPQGVTTVADMQADQQWGDGYQPILVSWYDHNKNAQGGNKGTRISFVDVKSGKYRHVLLVYPKRNSAGVPTYESLRASQNPSASGYNTALHAGGILWYGNFLFVADTGRGFRMFDVRRIFDLGASAKGTTSGGDKIGLNGADGLYYGHGYRYIWPQIGSWTRTADTGTGEDPTCTERDLSPQFSYVSLDRSGTDHLVAGEYCKKSMETNGRVFTYKIGDAFTNGELVTAQNFRWRAIEAYKLPVYRIQGATRFGGKWYLSQSNGNTTAGTLYISETVSTTDTVLKVASNQTLSIGPEDLAHWPKGTASAPTLGNIWTVAEHTGSGDRGKRMLYSVKPNN